MGLAGRIARRSLIGHPGRTMFSILGVAVGIATVIGVFTLDHVTVLSRTQLLNPDFGADLEVRPTTEDGDPRRRLLEMEGVAGVAAFSEHDVGFRPLEAKSGDDRPERIRMVALETGNARNLGVYHVDVGEDLTAETAEDGVLVGRSLATALKLNVGDRVVLTQPQKAGRKRCVDGVYTQTDEGAIPAREGVFEVRGILAREQLGRRSNGRVAIVDYDAGRDLLEDVYLESQFWVRRDDATDLEKLESGLSRSFSFKRNDTKAVGQMADERAFRNGVRMAGLFALLLGLFVIFHTLSMSLIERVREVGNLHALGATRMQIARVFFVEALFIAIVAGGLGLGGGIALAGGLLERGISTLGVRDHPVEPFQVPWDTVVPLALLGVGIALFGSVYPILRARDTDVIAALRGEDSRSTAARGFSILSTLLLVAVVPAAFFQVVPVVGAADPALIWTLLAGLVVLGLLIGLPLMAPSIFGSFAGRLARPFEKPFPLVGKLVSRSLKNSPARIGSSIAAIALVTSAFVGLRGMTNSLGGEIEEWGKIGAADKVWIEELPNVPTEELYAALHEIPEVRGVESRDANVFPSFLLFGMNAAELAGFGPLAADPELARRFAEEQTIVLSDRLARQRGLSEGDEVLIQTSGHGVQTFRVLAVSDAYGYFPHPDERAYGVVDERYLARYFCSDIERTTTIAVKIDGGDLGLVWAALTARYPDANLYRYDADAVIGTLVDDLRVDFVLFDIILALTAILAALGVLNGQLLSALERRKELGILRALGTTRGQITGAVILESGLVGGAGGLLGLLVGSGMTPVLVYSLRILSGLPLPLRFAGSFLGLCFAGAVFLAVFAALYPTWRMNRFDAVRAVRTG